MLNEREGKTIIYGFKLFAMEQIVLFRCTCIFWFSIRIF